MTRSTTKSTGDGRDGRPVLAGGALQVSVFVGVREYPDLAKPTDSVVRLAALDGLDMRGAESIEPTLFQVGREGERVTDRELCALLDRSGVRPGELVDEVLEGYPQIVDDVSSAPPPVGWGSRYADAQHALAGLRIVLAENAVYVLSEECPDLTVQRFKILACPIESHVGVVK